jgi:NDP-sugar pyrophosphorylase family protein
MLRVGGRALLAHLVALLRRHGVREIAINLHYRPSAITDYFGGGMGFGVQIRYSHEERLLGSAGALKPLEAFFRDGPFFVLYGDVLTDIDLTALFVFHRRHQPMLTIGLHQPDDPTRCGMAGIDDDGRVVEFVEKPAAGAAPGRWASAGIYVVEPSVLDLIPPGEPFDFGHDLIPLLLERGLPVCGWPTDALVLDIGSPERYLLAQTIVERRQLAIAA